MSAAEKSGAQCDAHAAGAPRLRMTENDGLYLGDAHIGFVHIFSLDGEIEIPEADQVEREKRVQAAINAHDALVAALRELADANLTEIVRYYNAHGDSAPSAIFFAQEQVRNVLAELTP